MQISKLHQGMILKNYKALCEVLEIEPKKSGSNSYKAQFKELERYVKYHKEGQKIIIDEILSEVKAKMDNRANNKGGNNVIYANDIEVLLMDTLIQTTDQQKELGRVGFSKSYLYLRLGLVNDNYKPTSDKVLQLSDALNVPYQAINECYNTTNGKLWNTVKSGLNAMRNKALINWDFGYNMVFKKDITDIKSYVNDSIRVASIDDRELIRSCELRALKEMNIPTKTKVFTTKKWNEFKELVTEYIQEIYPDLLHYYESVVIYFKPEEIMEAFMQLDNKNLYEIKQNLNGNISSGLDRTIVNRHNNAKKNIDNKAIVTSYDLYKVSAGYTNEQKGIKNKLVNRNIDNLIDFNFNYDGNKTISLKQQWDMMYKPSEAQEIKNNTNIATEQMSLFTEGFNDDIEVIVDNANGFEFIDDNHIPF